MARGIRSSNADWKRHAARNREYFSNDAREDFGAHHMRNSNQTKERTRHCSYSSKSRPIGSSWTSQALALKLHSMIVSRGQTQEPSCSRSSDGSALGAAAD